MKTAVDLSNPSQPQVLERMFMNMKEQELNIQMKKSPKNMKVQL